MCSSASGIVNSGWTPFVTPRDKTEQLGNSCDGGTAPYFKGFSSQLAGSSSDQDIAGEGGVASNFNWTGSLELVAPRTTTGVVGEQADAGFFGK